MADQAPGETTAATLGIVLMAVSFAYQKDWLGRKQASATPPDTYEAGR